MKGEIKEGAGFVKEELNEHGKDSKSQQKAQEGRAARRTGGRSDRQADAGGSRTLMCRQQVGGEDGEPSTGAAASLLLDARAQNA